MKKVALITCYFDPDYVRSLSLRAALAAIPDVELIVIKNTRRGLLRYPEVLWKICMVRLRMRPDVWLLTFRGQELLPFTLLLTFPKPLIFDEFLIPLAWASQEKHDRTITVAFQHALARIMTPLYSWWLRMCRFILADTQPDAELSAKLSGVDMARYRVIPVGAEEALFTPAAHSKQVRRPGTPFEVFFCGNMRPLYGLEYVLQAALILKDSNPDIHISVVGGKAQASAMTNAAKAKGAHVSYEAWVPFKDLPERARTADVCLAGPFGGSPQAMRVITGKTYQFLACAAPVVIGDSEAARLFTDRSDCLIVPQADANALAHALAWAQDHPKELMRIGAQGRKLYERAFSTAVITRLLHNILREV